MDSAFRLDPFLLQKGLFTLYNPRQGAKTILNVNYLPDLLQYVKQQLTPEELIRLEDYHLQNYLVELSIGYFGESEL